MNLLEGNFPSRPALPCHCTSSTSHSSSTYLLLRETFRIVFIVILCSATHGGDFGHLSNSAKQILTVINVNVHGPPFRFKVPRMWSEFSAQITAKDYPPSIYFNSNWEQQQVKHILFISTSAELWLGLHVGCFHALLRNAEENGRLAENQGVQHKHRRKRKVTEGAETLIDRFTPGLSRNVNSMVMCATGFDVVSFCCCCYRRVTPPSLVHRRGLDYFNCPPLVCG